MHSYASFETDSNRGSSHASLEVKLRHKHVKLCHVMLCHVM